MQSKKKKKKFWEIPLVHGGFCGNISLVLCNISRPPWHLFLVFRLKKKPTIPNRFKKERTLSLHGSSSMRLCYFFGLKAKHQFQAREWEWEAQVRFWTFRSESVKEYKITPLWSLLSNHRQSTRWHRPDGHPGGIHRARAGSEPCRTELFKSKKERKTGLVFLFPGVPYYFYMFFISVASDRNLHSKVRRNGPMWGTHAGECSGPPVPPAPGQQLMLLNPSTDRAGGSWSPSLPRSAILESSPQSRTTF